MSVVDSVSLSPDDDEVSFLSDVLSLSCRITPDVAASSHLHIPEQSLSVLLPIRNVSILTSLFPVN